jgi:hypothetical protein
MPVTPVSRDACYNVNKKEAKAVPLPAWSGPEGSRKLRFPDFMTMAQDGGKFVRPGVAQRVPKS